MVHSFADMSSPTEARLYLAAIEAQPAFQGATDSVKALTMYKNFKTRSSIVIRNIEVDKRSGSVTEPDMWKERALWVFAA